MTKPKATKPAKSVQAKRTKTTAQTTGVVAKIPQPHGGALNAGGTPGNKGGGRPPDEVRAKLRDLAHGKAVPFLSELLDGRVKTYLVGTCEKCRHEQGFDAETVEHLMKLIGASVDQRLKASEQTLKHGLQAKELVIASDTAAAFFDCVHTAIVELADASFAEQVKARALALMEAKA